ncbi:class F sortase [Rothia uropygioeca]|uniref:class F sortase n=1 Tax=Kocuria sp. 257 TaxID=2021970 RepID=UPI001EDFB515|nr:class F sortase [Kocuria sp. 257]
MMADFLAGGRGFLRVSAAAAVLLVSACAPDPGQGTATPEPSDATPTTSQSPNNESSASTPEPTHSDPTSPEPTRTETQGGGGAVLKSSRPTSLRIPSIGVDTKPLRLGLNKNHRLEVPPGDPGSPAGWYDQSPTPGERGPSVFLGHVNATDGGDGVFADLRSLKSGDQVTVAREDGSEARFTVKKGKAYSKDRFPTAEVYGHTDDAQLRLITCDGYDASSGLFDDNYVVYASLDRQK